METVKYSNLVAAKDNYRKHINKEALKELTASVKEKGIIQPILVRPSGEKFEVVAGNRRLAAAGLAGLDDIPVIVKDLTDEQVLEYQVVENNQRVDPNPMDEAFGFERLLSMNESHTAETVAGKIGRSLSYVTGRLKLLTLPKKAQKKILSGDISAGLALQLTRLKSSDEQKKFLELILEEDGMTIAQVRSKLKDYSTKLGDAIFDTAECSDCEFCSRNQSLLFPDLKKADNECMDSECFFTKTKAWHSARLEPFKEQGFKILTDIDEVRRLTNYDAKGSARIAEPDTEISHNSEKPKKYKKECMKCTEFHAYYMCEVERWSYYTDKNSKDMECGEICLNRQCLDKMNNKHHRVPDSSPSQNIRAKAEECRNRFLRSALPSIVEASETLQKRLTLFHLLDKYEGRLDGLPTTSDLIKEFDPEAEKEYCWFNVRLYQGVSRIPAYKLDYAIQKVLMAKLQETYPKVLLNMTPEAGIDMTHDFVMDEDFVKTKTKADLLVLALKLNIEVDVTEKNKKGEIVSAIMAKDLVGKVPDDIAKVCKISEQ